MHNYQIPPPAEWHSFEKLCHKLWMELLCDPNIQLHGRQGQSQSGIDVYGIDKNTDELYGIQCKGKNQNHGKPITETELKQEVEKAKTFDPRKLDVFILATTAPNDQKLQKLAREITEEHKTKSLFKVYVFGWGELEQRIAHSQGVLDEFYPAFSDKSKRILSNTDEILGIMQEITKHHEATIIPSWSLSIEATFEVFKKSSHGLLS